MSVLLPYVCVHYMWTLRGQKLLELLELESQIVVSQRVSARNQTPVLCESSTCSNYRAVSPFSEFSCTTELVESCAKC